ncbi:MAG: hypothetical protein AAF266_04790 [Planctomycetota bacterium]
MARSKDQNPGLVTGRPWWRWNLVTLAVSLLVLVWVRELGNVPASNTWTMVVMLFGAWYLVPTLAARRVPWPLSLASRVAAGVRRVLSTGPTPSVLVLCRLFAVLLVAYAATQCTFQLIMLSQQIRNSNLMWRGLPWGTGAASMLSVFWPLMESLALGMGLWTLADIGLWVRRAVDASDDSGPQGSLKPDNPQGR